jgi:ABC-type enterochelin transport system permease subunit
MPPYPMPVPSSGSLSHPDFGDRKGCFRLWYQVALTVVAFEYRQQIAEVGLGAAFSDDVDVVFDPVFLADHGFVGKVSPSSMVIA